MGTVLAFLDPPASMLEFKKSAARDGMDGCPTDPVFFFPFPHFFYFSWFLYLFSHFVWFSWSSSFPDPLTRYVREINRNKTPQLTQSSNGRTAGIVGLSGTLRNLRKVGLALARIVVIVTVNYCDSPQTGSIDHKVCLVWMPSWWGPLPCLQSLSPTDEEKRMNQRWAGGY